MYLVSKSNLMTVKLQPEDLGPQHHRASPSPFSLGGDHGGIQSMKTSILSANSTLCFSSYLRSGGTSGK